jgi:hypothetical protein
MADKTATPSSTAGDESRRQARRDVSTAIMVSPNGHPNQTQVFDLSESGARIGLPEDFEHGLGALVRLHFPKTHGALIVFAEIVRVAVDHLGVQFVDGQEVVVNQLIEELSERN